MQAMGTSKVAASEGVQTEKLRFGGLLALYSVFVLVEGMIRFISSDPDQDYDGLDGKVDGFEDVFPPIVGILASLGEVIFGAAGLFVGVGQLLFQMEMPSVTLAALGSMFIFGWFVFFSFALAMPIYRNENNQGPPAFPAGAWENDDERNIALVFGHIFGSISYCGVMQGMQFFSCLYLYNLQTGNEETTNDRNKFRVMWYGFLVFLGGIGALVLGSMISDNHDADAEVDYKYPPNLVYFPAMTVVSGLMLLVLALLTWSTIGAPQMATAVKGWALLTWLYLCSCHVMTQLTLIPGGPAAGAAQLICLSTSLVVGPAFFAHMQQTPPASVSS